MDDIRRKIDQNPALQQAADKLLQDLAKRMSSVQGEEILSAIIDKVREGRKLDEQYPQFVQLLERDPVLLHSFNELIELLSMEGSEPEGFIFKKKSPLKFLSRSPQALKEKASPGQAWQVELTQTLENLRNLFIPLSAAYRDPLASFDTRWHPIFREEITYAASTWEVALDAAISEEQAESLELLLQVVTVHTPEDQTLPEQVTASLSWGSYHQSTPLDLNGQTRFPPAEFAQILDEKYEKIAADLTLVIQAAE